MEIFTKKIKGLLLFLLLVLAGVNSVLAQVSSNMPTGGLGLSNDLSSQGPTPTFTPIGDIVLSSTAAADFATAANRRIRLNAPTNWEFDVTGVTVAHSGARLTASSLFSIAASNIIVQYTAGSSTADAVNTITISGLKVRSTTKILGVVGEIVRANTSNQGTINGFGNGAVAANLSKIVGSASQLLTLLPNQSLSPGGATGKAGTPTTPTAGTPFNVRVYTTDHGWNPVVSSDEIAITSNDIYAVLPINANLDGTANGSDFSVTLRTAVLSPAPLSQTITATNVTNGSITANTTTATRVSKGAFAKLLVLYPGETLDPGSPTGKSGTPNAPQAGVDYLATIYSVDNSWNTVSSTNNVGISATGVTNFTSPANSNLSGGVRTRNLFFRVPGEIPNVTAVNNTDGTKTAHNQVLPAVIPGIYAQLQVLLPGETAAPGTPTGKTGTPTPQVAGTPFTVTVNAVDGAWYPVTGIADVVHLTTNDANATMPTDLAMVNGIATFTTTTLVTALTNRTITATNVTDNTKTANTSSGVTVTAGAFTKLLVILPGETYAAGTATGKTGTPTDRTAGASFNVIVRSVDAHWNTVSSTNIVGLTSSDLSATLPGNMALSGGTRTFSNNVKLNTSGPATITASNITDPTKTASTSPSVNVVSGGYAKLQILLPGETADPGTPTGKTGTPTPQVAGTPFTVTVNAVNDAWYPVTGITDVVRLTTNDANATMPTDLAMVNGVATFTTTTLITAVNNTRTITATNITDNTKTANTSSGVTVTAGAFTKLLITLPGETYAAGTATGKTGTPTDRTAGVAFIVTVRAVDAYWNLVNTVTHTVGLTSSDLGATLPGNMTLSGGVRIFNGNNSVKLNTPGSSTITASNITDPTKTASTSPSVNVVSGGYAKLQILLPGETADPGTPTGKTGTPTPQVAGTPFTVTVRAVDAAWYPITGITEVVQLTSNDVNAIMPANVSMVNGVATFSTVTLVTATNRTITASNITDGSKTADTSPNVLIQAGAYAKLLVLLPNEVHAQGTATGISGNPSIPNRGTQFQIRIRAVDQYSNAVNGITNALSLVKSDPSDVVPATSTLVTNGNRTLNVTINALGVQTITITDGTTGFSVVVQIPEPTPTSQQTDYFRSAGSGLWSNSASWESSTNGVTNWHEATLVPNSTSNIILIRSGHTIDVTANVTVDQVIIENGGKVDVQVGRLTIANGADPYDFQVDGILANSSTTSNSITTTGALQIGTTGRYQHNFTTISGTIPTANWVSGSVCEIIGYTGYVSTITGSGQNFSTFQWNATDQNVSNDGPILGTGFNVDNLIVTSTGSGVLHLGTTGGTININGNYTQTGGTVVINKTSGTLNLNFGGDFSIANADFIKGAGASKIYFNGTGNQELSAVNVNSSPNGLTFWDVTFANGATKTFNSGNFSVATTGVLTMEANTTLGANGNLTVLSSASSSGRIAPIPSSAEITGNVRVERFVTGGAQDPYRTYRLFSSPIHEGSNTYSFSQFIDDIIITGAPGNGFDPSTNNQPSAFRYNIGGTGFVAIPNLSATLQRGQGAYVYFRGNRDNIASKVTPPTYADPESVIMDFEGVLNQQNITVPLNGGTLVGNPYASSIDWNSASITKTNLLNNVIRIWNPATRSYNTYDGLIGVPSGMINNIIPTGQGFFVQASGAGSLTFTENAKVTPQPPLLLMSAPVGKDLLVEKSISGNGKIMAAANNPTSFATSSHTELRLTLSKNGLSPYKEETAVVFQAGRSAAYNAAEDAIYFSNPGEQKVFLSSLSANNTNLVINYMPEISEGSNVKLNLVPIYDSKTKTYISGNASGDYQLEIKYNNLPVGYSVKVNDNYLGTSTVLQNGDLYSLNIDETKSESYGANRLSVSFEAPSTLPVNYTSFTATKTNQGVLVKWSTDTEVNNNRFEVERAGDDKVYVKLHTELAKGNNASYSYIDKNPLIGNNYYRLIQVDNDNISNPTLPQVINYTGELSVATDVVSIFPNPVISNFTVRYNGTLKANQQTLKIVSVAGEVLLMQNVSKGQLLSGYDINISDYPTGAYIVEIYENSAQRIGQIKLIKQ